MDADSFLLALCVWREARDEPQLGWIAVAWAMKNRMARRSKTLYTTLYSRFLFNARVRNTLTPEDLWPKEEDPVWVQIQAEAAGVWHGVIPDPTGGASAFHTRYTRVPTQWIEAEFIETAKIGKYIFFREMD